jgi:hypothetical protein
MASVTTLCQDRLADRHTDSRRQSGPIATDRGGGTIVAPAGTVTTSGQDSPGIYSTGDITVSNATISASGAKAPCSRGLTPSPWWTPTCRRARPTSGGMIYQSISGDAQGTFFVLGQAAKSKPDLVRAMAQGGHYVANHTYSHPSLEGVSQETS